MAQSSKKAPPREPLLEWISAGIGLVLTLGIMAVIGREAMRGETHEPPAIEVVKTAVHRAGTGFVVEVKAINHSGGTAAVVEVEGVLKDGETEVETAGLTFDYVPGHAERRGGLFFTEDPARHTLELRPLGYQRP